jgi:hypothetical protein
MYHFEHYPVDPRKGLCYAYTNKDYIAEGSEGAICNKKVKSDKWFSGCIENSFCGVVVENNEFFK